MFRPTIDELIQTLLEHNREDEQCVCGKWAVDTTYITHHEHVAEQLQHLIARYHADLPDNVSELDREWHRRRGQ